MQFQNWVSVDFSGILCTRYNHAAYILKRNSPKNTSLFLSLIIDHEQLKHRKKNI